MEKHERYPKGIWIPIEIYIDEDLTASEMLLYAEINSLSSNEKGCWASNKYLSKYARCSERQVQRAIAHLKELAYIRVQQKMINNKQQRILTPIRELLNEIEKDQIRQCAEKYEG